MATLGHDHGPRHYPDVILDHDRSTEEGKGGIVVQMLGGQNGDVGRDAHVVANGQGRPGVQAAVAVDVTALSNAQAPSSQLARTVEPEKTTKIDSGAVAELDAQDVAIPEVAHAPRRDAVHEVVGQILQHAYNQEFHHAPDLRRAGPPGSSRAAMLFQ
jgi:hypothetical protein